MAYLKAQTWALLTWVWESLHQCRYRIRWL